MQQNRLVFIDWMRSIAIIFMVLCHAVIYWSLPDTNQASVYFFANHVIGDFAAPLFLFLVGLSSSFSSRNPTRRGILIFIVGLSFALLARGPQTVWDWDVLTLIGTSVIFLGFLRKQPNWVFLALILVLVVLASWLREVMDFLSVWGGGMTPASGIPDFLKVSVLDPLEEYQAAWSWSSIWKGFLVRGYFPIFPWLAFPIAGLLAGRYLPKKNRLLPKPVESSSRGAVGDVAIQDPVDCFSAKALRNDENVGFRKKSNVFFAALGSALIMAALFLEPWSFYPDSTGMFLLQLGFCLSILAFFQVLNFKDSWGLAERLSRYSLTIYVLHHLFLLWVQKALGDFHVMPLTGLYVVFALLMSLYGLCYYWDRIGGKYSFEWCLKRPILNRT